MITQKGKQHQLANEVELILDMMVIIQKKMQDIQNQSL
jgi:hypothetical protein